MDTAQGPNEKKALSYPDAIINLQLANAEETGLLLNAKPAVLLDELLKIVRKYPLQATEENNSQAFILPYAVNEFKPEIIISESFDK